MGLISEITNLINEHGSSTILRERLSLWEEKYQALLQENVNLKRDLANAVKTIDEQDKELSEYRNKDQFTECRGALFKRKGSGGYDKAVYCITCRSAMWSFDIIHYKCDTCKKRVGFSSRDLDQILNELEDAV